MDDGQLPASPPPAPARSNHQPWWRIARASISLILDFIEMSRGAGDILDPLIMATVIEGNLALINQDPELQRTYADLDAVPPDELRRPVSIAAVAGSLNVPYETVRRRVARLAKAGALVQAPKGLMVPSGALGHPMYVMTAVARYERMKRFYFELKGMGVLEEMPAPDPSARPLQGPPVRLVNRLVGEYMLRIIEVFMGRLGDAVTGLVAMEMGRANAEHLDDAARQVEGPMPDDLRKPIAMLALAKRLRLPPETVRRHVKRLEDLGLCHKAPGGRLAEIRDLRGPDGYSPIAWNLMNMMRLMSRLSAYGVCAYWDAEAAGVTSQA